MAIPDANILTSLLKDFTAITANSRPLIQGYAVKALITLTTIDILVVCLYCMMDNQDIVKTMLRRTLKYASFAFLVMYFKDIVNAFSSSFIKIGLEAGGKVLTANDFTNPSFISTLGIDMVGPFVQNIVDGKGIGATNATFLETFKSLPSAMLLGLVYLMILACFFAIAINIFILYIEFAVFASIALILIPFGVWDKTEFIFDKAKNGVINYGIKYMTLAFIVSIAMSKIRDWQLPPDPTFQQALYVLLGMLAITYLSWHAPSVAAGFAGGSGGSMSGAAIGGFAGGAAGGVAKGAGAVVGRQNGKFTGALPAVAGVAAKAATVGGGMAHNALSRMSPNVYGGLAKSVGDMANQFSKGSQTGSSPTNTAPPTPPSGVDLNQPTNNTGTGDTPTPAGNTATPAGTPPIKPVAPSGVSTPPAPNTDTSTGTDPK